MTFITSKSADIKIDKVEGRGSFLSVLFDSSTLPDKLAPMTETG